MSDIQPWKVAEKRGKKENRIPPFAPSENEQEFYKKYLKLILGNKELPKRALILGATPELRDAAIELGIESIAVDISQEMMDKFSSLMEYNGHSLDKQIVNNWLEMDFPESYFGVVMGDASFNNLTSREHNSQLLEICSKIIAKQGFLVLRQVVYPKEKKGYDDVLKLVKDFRNKVIDWRDFYIELRFNIFKDKVYNEETFQYDAKKNYKLIEELHSKNIINEEEQTLVNRFRNDVTNTFYSEEEFIKMIKEYGSKHLEDFHDKPYKFFDYLFMMTFQKNEKDRI